MPRRRSHLLLHAGKDRGRMQVRTQLTSSNLITYIGVVLLYRRCMQFCKSSCTFN